jgi:PucR C-terminal helix-turn-helix domain/GGDEF-like domain
MEPESSRAQDAAQRRAWEQVLRPVAAELMSGAREMSAQVTRAIGDRLPGLLPDAESFEANRASSEASILGFAQILEQGADPAVASLGEATLAYTKEGARRGVPVTILIRSYRLGHAAAWEEITPLIAAHSGDQEQRVIAIELCSAWLFAYVDAALCLAEDFYGAERGRWVRSTALQAPEEGRDTHAAMEAAIAQVQDRLGVAGGLVHSLGLLSTAAWIGTRDPVASRQLDDLRFDMQAAPGVRIAIGEPGQGIAGFRQSHDEAVQARRVAELATRPAGTVTRYSRVALAAIATADLDQARVFVGRELRGLAAADDLTTRLTATLRTYLEEHSSRSRTAKRLGIHENTVSYRIKQAQSDRSSGSDEPRPRCGRSLDSPFTHFRRCIPS